MNKKFTRTTAAAVSTFALTLGLAALGFAQEAHEGAHHVDTAAQMKDFMWRCVDFGALVVIAVWALKKADVKGSLAARREGIERTLKEAVEAKEAAEKERIVAEAKVAAERIKAQAESAAAQEVLKAKSELRAEAAKLAVELAEQKIVKNIAKGDQDKLVGEYISKVVTLH